jgi:hypothetical protein
MSEAFTVYINATEFKKVELRLGAQAKQASTAISRALNRAADKARTEAVKQVTGNYYIKQKLIREKKIITTYKANKTRLRSLVIVRDSPIPMNYFKFSPGQPRPKKPPAGGLKVAVKKDGIKTLKRAFVANINGPKIFDRVGKNRLPIKRLYGPSVAQITGVERNRTVIEKESAEMYQKRLDHEIKRIQEAKK